VLLGGWIGGGAPGVIFKRLAARESPKAMEPPAVSRFLYRIQL
jgi:hypothetical protein